MPWIIVMVICPFSWPQCGTEFQLTPATYPTRDACNAAVALDPRALGGQTAKGTWSIFCEPLRPAVFTGIKP